MLRDIWTKTLWDQRRALLGWAIGFAAVSLIYGAFYPIAATPEYEDIIDALPEALAEGMGWSDITSAAGYIGSTVYGILGPVLAIVFAIGMGARAIAGDEEAGTLELLVAEPVTRRSVVLQRATALGIALLAAGAIVFLAILALRGPIDLDLAVANLAAASLNLALLGGVFGAVALFTGALTGRRGLVIGVAAGIAVVAYLANALAPQLEGFEWIQNLSPFFWFDGSGTLRDGMDLVKTGLLAGSVVLLVAGSVVAFDRRDVAV